MRLLDTTGRGGGLAGGLGSELLTGSLATSGLTYWGKVSIVLSRRRDSDTTTPTRGSAVR